MTMSDREKWIEKEEATIKEGGGRNQNHLEMSPYTPDDDKYEYLQQWWEEDHGGGDHGEPEGFGEV